MYPSAKKYVAYIESISKDNLTDWGLGDWIPVRSKSDVTLTTSIYYYTDVSIMAKAAKLFGYVDDAVYYEALADRIKESINNRYLDKETGLLHRVLKQSWLCLFIGILFPMDIGRKWQSS